MSSAGIYEGGVRVLLDRNLVLVMVVDTACVSSNSGYRLFDRSASKIVSESLRQRGAFFLKSP